jgi:fatty acid desaturase
VSVTDLSPSPSPEDKKLARARRRVAALKGFYVHLTVFVLVMAGLAIVNFLTGPPWWMLWALLGWGIGILAHGLAVSARTSRAIANWEERKLQQYVRDEQ